jgi:dynein heavy chain 2
MTSEAERLKASLEKAEAVLNGAQELLSKLGGEKERWDSQCRALDEELHMLPKLSLLAAAFNVYLGGSPEDERESQIQKWQKILNVQDAFLFQRFMKTESQLLQYKAEGLPADDLSIQNSIVILETSQVPLIIDPASQAVEWLKTHLQNQQATVEVTTLAHERFATTFELAVRFGKTLIVTEVDKVEPMLYPILRNDLMSAGPKKTVQVGDKQIDWQDSFRLYLVTRDTHIALPPDAKNLINEVNFAITRSGLEGQLLGVTIQHEKPELEEQKSKLLHQEEEYKMQLSGLEDTLLRDLAASETSLLENKALIDSLNQIKSKSVTIVQSLEESHSLQESIDRQRNSYRSFASVGSSLFFLIKSLPAVNHMYQFSLSVFLKLFNAALKENADQDALSSSTGEPHTLETRRRSGGDISDKIANLKSSLLRRTYFYVCRSLFKVDRLLFGMHMCHGLFPVAFEEKEWDLFMGRTVVPSGHRATKPPTWLDPDTLPAFNAFESQLPELLRDMSLDNHADDWYRWMRSKEPEAALPSACNAANKKFSPFQHLLITQTFRPDRVPHAMEQTVTKLLKLPTAQPPVLSLANVVDEESSNTEPILLVTTAGADPSQELQDLADKKVGREKFTALAMGGGQMETASKLLRECALQGSWLCLKNLHLVVAWLPQLEKEFNMLEPHESFRLWLTSEPHDKFPALLLSQSLKVTFEAPPGIKNNMMKTYTLWSHDFLRNLSPFPAQVLFILAWFHAILQERRNYIPQGWVKFHEFSTADLRCAADIIVANCSKDLPDWPTLYGLFENAIYGGRMDSNADVRILRTYLSGYFNNEMLGLGHNAKSIKDAAPPSKRTTQLSKGLSIPQSNQHDDFLKVIGNLSDVDGPQHFMLPANSDRLVQRMLAQKIVDNLNRIGSASVSSGGFNREQWAKQLEPVMHLWDALTKDRNKELTGDPPKSKPITPVTSFVAMELALAMKLVQKVAATMQEIKDVVSGHALLSSKLQQLAQCLAEGSVPLSWDKDWEGPEQISAWLKGIVNRTVALHTWLDLSQKDTLLKGKLRLNELFRPQTFLNALRQETAQKSGIALDELILDCQWGEGHVLPSAQLSIQIEGLNIQGVKFEHGKLVELSADSPSVNVAPVCNLAWVQTQQDFKHLVSCPAYFSGTREKHLCDLLVPCQGDHSRWILTGFALLIDPI